MALEIIKVSGLSFTYAGADLPSLCDVSFSLPSGSFAVLTGDSGSGKSTLLRLLKRELSPRGKTEGEITLCGIPRTELSERDAAAKIGFVAQQPEEQIVTDTVWHELAFGLESLGADGTLMRRRTAEIASFFGIGAWYRQPTDTLSGGQKQLLSLASVLATEPEVLLLDEPTSRLDPVAEAEFLSLLERLNRELGITVLLSAHDTERVFGMADRVLHLENGRLTLDGTPASVAAAYPETKRTGLPCASQIWKLTDGTGTCPLTIREGRKLLAEKRFSERMPREKIFGEPILQAQELCFRFTREGDPLLDRAELRLRGREHLCLLGGNGAGKTTFLRVLSGFLKPVSGKILLAGKPVSSYGASLWRGNLAYLPQEPASLFGEETVRAELLLYCRKAHLEDSEALSAAERFGITPLLDRHPLDLSGGELQLCALARVFLQKPRVLLLDEPTKGLDANARLRLGNLLRTLVSEGASVLTVTHDVLFAAECADTCTMLFDGTLSAPEPTELFFAQNRFYTTPTSRMTNGVCITPEEVETRLI